MILHNFIIISKKFRLECFLFQNCVLSVVSIELVSGNSFVDNSAKMTHLNIEKISLASRDREKEEQKKTLRKKTILVLIQEYLKENGFVDTAETLKSECRFSTDDYTVCDNIHLDSIVQDFESYHFLKYQKTPQLIKKIPNIDLNLNNARNVKGRKLNKQLQSASMHRNLSMDVSPNEITKPDQVDCGDSYNVSEVSDANGIQLMEPLGSFGNYSVDWKNMAEIIMQDFTRHEKSTTWNDIIGHGRVKQVLKEAVVYPLKYSNLFKENSSWKSILLYGPSGTGKTLLASTAASESDANFFKVCCSTLVSKWRGESEKLMKVLFDLGKHYAPSIIFIDEIDALISQRGGDHEASRRLKTEFFLQMDALSTCDKFVVLIGATNMPWDLDHALLRRMEKRVLVSTPSKENRLCLFKKFLSPTSDASNSSDKSDLNFDELANISNLYSAFDIQLVCKEAKMCSFRKAVERIENAPKNLYSKTPDGKSSLKMSDVIQAVAITKPAATQDIDKYLAWKEKYGSE